jgi:glycosyltransferase involved in cell wall biosynthesis
MMRLLYFSEGHTVHDRRFLDALTSRYEQVMYLRLDQQQTASNELPSNAHPISWPHGLPGSDAPRECHQHVDAMRNLLREFNPDVVHAGPIQTCGYIAARAGAPLLLMSWGYDLLRDSGKDAVSREATRFALEHASIFFCDSRSVLQRARDFTAIDDSRILLMPWGVDLAHFIQEGPCADTPWDSDGDVFTVISTRSWDALYNVDKVLAGFAAALKQKPNLRLLLIGAGSQASNVKNFVETNRLSDVVFLAGPIPNHRLVDYLRASDLYVSASPVDGTSVSMLEAMATALPVLVSDIASNREWVEPGSNGWLADVSGEVTASICDALLAAAGSSEESRSRMGETNRRQVQARADWSSNPEFLFQAYDSVAGKQVRRY